MNAAVVLAKGNLQSIGIDEAGRGPILGPMAIAVVMLEPGIARKLKRLGVADSKRFGFGEDARSRRAELCQAIEQRALGCRHRLVSPQQIDEYTYRGQLNGLERKIAIELLQELGISREAKIYCDGRLVFGPLQAHFPRLRAVDDGENRHLCIAAASIVAKHHRDQAFSAIAKRYEPEFGEVTGGGYLNAATHRFLKAFRERYGTLPEEARKSWGAGKNPTLALFPEAEFGPVATAREDTSTAE